jgi:hypothetical protein
VHTQIEEALRNVQAVHLIGFEPAEARGIDAIARVDVNGHRLRLALEWRNTLDPRNIERLTQELGKAAGNAIPVIAARYIAPSVKRRLEEARVGWLDSLGGIHLEGAGTLIHVDRPTPRGYVPRPRGNIFGSAAGRVVQALLEDPSGSFDLERLRRDAIVTAASTVSRALSSLVDAGYVTRVEGGWTVPDGGALLDAWLDAGLRKAGPRRVGFFSREPITKIRQRLTGWTSDVELLLTGPSAAEMYRPLLPATSLDIYVFPPALSASFAERTMSLIPTESAANVDLWIATNDSPRVGRSLVHDVPIVGRAQLLLDLTRTGGRSKQVVEELRREWDM